jgi:uncharacterized protein (DUF697 family)
MPAKSPLASLAGGIGSILDVVREVDVRPIRAAAETPFVLAFVSRDEPLAEHLVMLMYRGQRDHDIPRVRSCVALPFEKREAALRANIAVIITREDADNNAELELVRQLDQVGIPTIAAFLEEKDALSKPFRSSWLPAEPITLHLNNGVLDEADAVKQLIKAVRKLKAVDDLALARHLPAFRETVSRALVDDVAFANAVYATGTGVLEMNPIATIPLNAADMVVLTKNQAIMAYKIALAMGLNAEFRDVMPQLAAVLGSGFAFRQIARQLIGLVPGLGILPKVAVAFAGTHATGEIVYRWCATGERINRDAIKMVYDRALERGRDVARSLFKKRKLVKEKAQPARRQIRAKAQAEEETNGVAGL